MLKLIVRFSQWNFRIGFTPREGMVIYSVAYVDGSRGRRPVAHRLSFVEMVVPYGDPNDPHYRKNAFDAGEDGLGKNAHSLKKVNAFIFRMFQPFISSFGLHVIESVFSAFISGL